MRIEPPDIAQPTRARPSEGHDFQFRAQARLLLFQPRARFLEVVLIEAQDWPRPPYRSSELRRQASREIGR
jgi:hypothetical protein